MTAIRKLAAYRVIATLLTVLALQSCASMSPDYENKRLLLEIPYSSGDNTNPQKVIDDLGEMALLTFREVDETEDGYVINEVTGRVEFLPTDRIVIEGSDIDVLNNPLFRMTENQKLKWFHKYQHIYAPFLYLLFKRCLLIYHVSN